MKQVIDKNQFVFEDKYTVGIKQIKGKSYYFNRPNDKFMIGINISEFELSCHHLYTLDKLYDDDMHSNLPIYNILDDDSLFYTPFIQRENNCIINNLKDTPMHQELIFDENIYKCNFAGVPTYEDNILIRERIYEE